MYCIKKQLLRGLLLLSASLLFTQLSNAQVTIGGNIPPNENALLDLQEQGVTTKGLLLPRVALERTTSFAPMQAHNQGMAVYNTATIADVTPGYYYNNGSKWVKLFSVDDAFFNMPAVVLPIDESDPAFNGTTFTVNLYDAYSKQFEVTGTNTAVSDRTAKLPIYGSDQLFYFITYFDDAVFTNVAVSSLGLLTYKVKPGSTQSDKTFMNIILKVK